MSASLDAVVDGKVCPKCKVRKSRSEFHNAKGKKDGKQSHCKPCLKQSTAAWHSANRKRWREIQRDSHLKKNYGLTHKQYEAMYAAQGGRCAICGDEHQNLCVDHDHRTGKVRELLCNGCNHGVGQFKERIEAMLAAAAYVKKHEGRHERAA